jgi:hypothetical protein
MLKQHLLCFQRVIKFPVLNVNQQFNGVFKEASKIKQSNMSSLVLILYLFEILDLSGVTLAFLKIRSTES